MEIALEIVGNKNLNKLDLTRLKKIEATGDLKVKIIGNGFEMTPEEKKMFLERTGLKESEVYLLATTTTSTTTTTTTTSTPEMETNESSLQRAETIDQTESNACGKK